MIITLAGHVDHGKTALVQALTGVDTDRLQAEKKRGLTIELGFAYAEFAGKRVGFVDVPGHHKFIRTMIAGIRSEQFAMLVVAADEGPKPQTVEHLDILETIGLTRGMVVFSRADLASRERRDQTQAATRSLLERSFLRNAEAIWCSARSGEGIEHIKQVIGQAADRAPPRSGESYFRLSVDRAFHLSGAGLVVTGAVHSGALRTGEVLAASRSNRPIRARSLRVLDQDAASTQQGDRVAINVTGVNLSDIKRGDWLLPSEANTPTSRVSIQFRASPSLPRALSRWTSVHVHHGAAHLQGRLRLADAHLLQSSDTCFADCLLAEPIVAKWGDPVLIRDGASETTLGGGPVIDTCIAQRSGRHWMHGRSGLLAALAMPDPLDSLRAVLEEMPTLPLSSFASVRNLPETSLLETLHDAGIHCWQADGKQHVALDSTLAEARTEILRRVDDWHQANPDARGLGIETLRRASNRPHLLLSCAISQLLASKAIRTQSGALQRPNFRSQRTPEEKALLSALAQLENETPTLGDLGESLAMTPQALRKAAKGIEATGDIVFVNDRRLVRRDVMQKAINLAHRLESPEGFVVREFRDLIGLGRNACIDILEYLDRSGVTRRIGDRRRVNHRH